MNILIGFGFIFTFLFGILTGSILTIRRMNKRSQKLSDQPSDQ